MFRLAKPVRFLLFAICLVPIFGQANFRTAAGTANGELFGQVLNQKNLAPIENCRIYVTPGDTVIQTNAKGEFALFMPVGIYKLVFMSAAFLPVSQSNVIVRSGAFEEVEILLPPKITDNGEKILEFQELSVQTKKMASRTKGHEAVGTYKLQRNDLLRTPGSIQDISYFTQFQPGVNRTNDQRTDLAVRGGGPEENAYLIDGIPIFSINHFESNDLTSGAIGNINPYFIDHISFHNGAFAARNPDKLSGIIDINFKKGNSQNHSGTFAFDAAGTGGLVEGPVPGLKGKGTYGLTVRYSSLSFLDAVGIIDFGGIPKYNNAHLKLFYGERNWEFQANLLMGRDKITSVEEGENKSPSWPGERRATYVLSELDKPFSRNLFGSIRATRKRTNSQSSFYAAANSRLAEYESSEEAFLLESDTLVADTIRENGFYDTKGTRLLYGYDQKHFLGDNLTFQYGMLHTYILLSTREEWVDSKHFNPNDKPAGFWDNHVPIEMEKDTYNAESDFYTIAGYAEVLHQTKTWDVYLGYRHLYDEYVNAGAGGPRFGLKRHLGNHTLKYAFGMHTQSPTFQVIVYEKAKEDLRMPKSLQNVMGWEARLNKGYSFNLEIFDKESYRLPRINGNTAHDTGRVACRGVEVFVKKSLQNRIWATMTYSWSWNREKREGHWEKYDYSIPHYGSLALGYDLHNKVTASLRYSTASGMPYTPETEVSPARYSRTTLPYSRLDVRMDYRKSFSKYSLALYMEITNLLDRQNVFVSGEDNLEDGWTFFPVGGIHLAF